MLLSVTTTHYPATDLGYLLVKHPDRVHAFELPTGTAYVCFPEATPARCTAALVLEIDPARLVPRDGFTLGRHVNDRPYAASSLLAAALNRAFRSALRGSSAERPALAAQPIPLEIRVPVLRCRGGADLTTRLFEPLGWRVSATPIPLDETHPEWGLSRYVDLTLVGQLRLADALSHLYVLLPVLDDTKHYWVAPDEVDKLVRAGEGWLAQHPERDLISRRYLLHRRALAAEAIGRLEASRRAETLTAIDDAVAGDTVEEHTEAVAAADEEAQAPAEVRLPLARQRHAAVLAALAEAGAVRVLDLGCGTGALIAELVKHRSVTEIVGVDVSPQVLDVAHRRLRLDDQPSRSAGRVRLLQSALTYTDDRLTGYDAAVLMEVIEHVDEARLPALAGSVFGHARPATVIVTTPNVEYNVRYEGLAAGSCATRTTGSSGPGRSSPPGRPTWPTGSATGCSCVPSASPTRRSAPRPRWPSSPGRRHSYVYSGHSRAVAGRPRRRDRIGQVDLRPPAFRGDPGAVLGRLPRARRRRRERPVRLGRGVRRPAPVAGIRLRLGRLTVVDATNVQPTPGPRWFGWPGSTTCCRWRSCSTCPRSCAGNARGRGPTGTSAGRWSPGSTVTCAAASGT